MPFQPIDAAKLALNQHVPLLASLLHSHIHTHDSPSLSLALLATPSHAVRRRLLVPQNLPNRQLQKRGTETERRDG